MDADWSLLPLDILTIIATKLKTFEDFVYFSAVCRCWNQGSSLIKNNGKFVSTVPWLLLVEKTTNNPNCVRKIFSPPNNKCYQLNLPETFGKRCYGSTHGWVVMVDRNFNVQLFNPITKGQIHFPSLETLPKPPLYQNSWFKGRKHYINWCLGGFCSKLVVLKVSQGGHHEFVIMILYDFMRSAAFARHGDQSWTPIFIKVDDEYPECTFKVYDAVGMDDYAFILYRDGSIVYLNFKITPSHELAKPIDYSPPADSEILKVRLIGNRHVRYWDGKMYLVQSGCDLLMVLRYKKDVPNSENTDGNYDVGYRTRGFDVYKLDHNDKRWVKMSNLGDVALFVGCNSSMSVSTVETESLQRSCIYFTDDEDHQWRRVKKFGGHDMGVYDVTSRKFRKFYKGDDTRGSLFCPPIWFVPQF